MWILILMISLPLMLFAAVCICTLRRRKARNSGCIIVLGAKVHPDGSMSKSLMHRCEAAMAAWKDGAAPKLILCGGRVGEAPCSEASVMEAFLMEQGMPADALLLEDKSQNTVENLKNAKEIMAANGFADAAIVTSDYHVQRAIWIARKFAIRACGIPAKSPQKLQHRLKCLTRECVSWCVFWYYEVKLRGRG